MTVPYNFAPKGWAFCNGQILPIQQYTALFSLLGTTYGGNGTTTFALPNLQGRTPFSQGQGPGLTDHVLGEADGVETVTLQTTEIPAHSHAAQFPACNDSTKTAQNSPSNGAYSPGDAAGSGPMIYATGSSATMGASMS